MNVTSTTLLRRMTSRLRLRHMQALVALDDLRSMSRAAEDMGMSQSAMTQLVAELESLLEVKLFLRHSRGVEPTDIAVLLLGVARRMLVAAEDGAGIVSAASQKDTSYLRLASTVAGSGILLYPALPRFSRDHPSVHVYVENIEGQDVKAAFSADDIDLICCRERQIVPEGWTFESCVQDELVIVGGPRHPLATRSNVSVEQLATTKWLQNQVATLARQEFESFLSRAAWSEIDEVRIVSRSPMLIWSMLRDGTLLSMVPRSALAPWIDQGLLVIIRSDISIPLAPVGFYRRNTAASPLLQALAHCLSRSQDC